MLRRFYVINTSVKLKPLFYCKNKNNIRWNTNTAQFVKTQQSSTTSENSIKWIVGAIPATAFVLGCWQVYRLQWKLNLIDELKTKSNATPIDLPHDLSQVENLEYQPVRVRGEFLHDKEFFIGPRAFIENDATKARFGSLVSDPRKNQGYLLITPFRLSGTNEIIIVNRGWIPKDLKPKEERAPSNVNGEIELVGLVRTAETRAPFIPKNNPKNGSWFYRDLKTMSEYLNCAPVWLDARGIADPPDGWPIPNQTRVTLRNEHFSYLVTWFSLSGFTSYMWYRYFVRKLPLI